MVIGSSARPKIREGELNGNDLFVKLNSFFFLDTVLGDDEYVRRVKDGI